jgi:hypothetical protein
MLSQLLSFSFVCFVLGTCFRRRYLSPIADVPGPLVASFSLLWQLWHIIKGHTEEATIAAHKRYGKFVRISHKEVSISDPDAIRAVLLAPIPKASWYQIFNLPDSRFVNQMGELDPKRHVHKQRNVAAGYAFSNVIQSEPFIDELVRIMETQFDRYTLEGKPIHFNDWFN